MLREKRMNEVLVSICIPTFNRSEQLKMTIDSIVCQKEFLDGEVEIVVSDNASTDDTERICNGYGNQYENFLYFKNAENVLDKNFPLVLCRGNGRLRKLNNDTFTLQNNALACLCDIAHRYNDNKPCLFLSNGRHKWDYEVEYNFRDFVLGEGHWITWIGSFTIWGEDCVDIENDSEGYELRLWQVKKMLQLSSKKNKIVVIDTEIGKSIAAPNKDLSYGLYEVFYTNFLYLIKPYVDSNLLTYDDYLFIEKNILFDFFADWIINWKAKKTDLVFSGEDLEKLITNQYKNKPYWKEYKRYYIKRLFKRKYFWPFIGKISQIKKNLRRKCKVS